MKSTGFIILIESVLYFNNLLSVVKKYSASAIIAQATCHESILIINTFLKVSLYVLEVPLYYRIVLYKYQHQIIGFSKNRITDINILKKIHFQKLKKITFDDNGIDETENSLILSDYWNKYDYFYYSEKQDIKKNRSMMKY